MFTIVLSLIACATIENFGTDYNVATTGVYELEDDTFGFSLDPNEGTVALTLQFLTSEIEEWSTVEFSNNDLDGNGAFNLHIDNAPDSGWVAMAGTGRESGGYNHPICTASNEIIYPSGDMVADVAKDDLAWGYTAQQTGIDGICYVVYHWFTDDSEPTDIPVFD